MRFLTEKEAGSCVCWRELDWNTHPAKCRVTKCPAWEWDERKPKAGQADITPRGYCGLLRAEIERE